MDGKKDVSCYVNYIEFRELLGDQLFRMEIMIIITICDREWHGKFSRQKLLEIDFGLSYTLAHLVNTDFLL